MQLEVMEVAAAEVVVVVLGTNRKSPKDGEVKVNTLFP